MKKTLVFLTALLLSVGTVAKSESEFFKAYVIQDNTLNYCLFPEIYHGNENEVLEKWWADTENGRMKHAYYLKLKMRLAQKIMPSDMADKFYQTSAYQAEYKQALKRYSKQLSIKSKKECSKVKEFASNLIEEYDEFNEKWRKNFSNP